MQPQYSLLATPCSVTCCHSECCLPPALDFDSWWLRCTFLIAQLFAPRAFNKYDMGTLTWLDVKTLERVPTLLLADL